MDEVEADPALFFESDILDIVETDLYDDLFFEDENSAPPVTTISIEALKEKIETLNKEKKEALQQVAELKGKNAKLKQERTVLVNNLSSIFKTAQLEIKRKDMFIKELREENQRLKERR
ncbi:hypothetical protein CBR_g8605 [Chara braunii]|uniref:Uncharacterized protein n=1 Tax=Chara braunii TaxID=69332 RepID=A0A388JS33_CHABU|nr:hypothetical protein CBR_g8605 [Chara braunii]|eukprot:GBG60583.1 hypothetical protein CBR_g8605 [Chara braunii]